MRLRLTLGGKARLRAVLDKLGTLDAEYCAVPAGIDEQGDEVELTYPSEDPGTVALSDVVASWQGSLAASVPEIIDLARFVGAAAEALHGMALVAPVTLRCTPDRVGPWRLLVVPLVEISLADWARSSPDAWLWTPASLLLGKADRGSAYAVGAALHTGLVGDLVTPGESAGRRFARALRGWVGAPARLGAAIDAAVPASFEDERTELRALVLELLEGTAGDGRKRLATLAAALSPHRAALRWEYEGRADVALAMVERAAKTTDATDVPWELLARLRGGQQDVDGQLDAALRAIGAGDADAPRDLALLVRRLVATGSPAEVRPLIERAVDGVNRQRVPLSEHGRLHFAHIEACYLDRADAAAQRLADPIPGWNGVVRAVILARIHAGRAEWAHTSRLCRDARAATLALDGGGGALGRYVVAYLDHLDGAANAGAVRTYSDPSYLADAFGRFVASLDAAEPEDPLVAANIHWLRAIGSESDLLRVGVDAYLAARGIAATEVPRGAPALLWYDAARLLPLSGAP